MSSLRQLKNEENIDKLRKAPSPTTRWRIWWHCLRKIDVCAQEWHNLYTKWISVSLFGKVPLLTSCLLSENQCPFLRYFLLQEFYGGSHGFTRCIRRLDISDIDWASFSSLLRFKRFWRSASRQLLLGQRVASTPLDLWAWDRNFSVLSHKNKQCPVTHESMRAFSCIHSRQGRTNCIIYIYYLNTLFTYIQMYIIQYIGSMMRHHIILASSLHQASAC